MAIEHALTILSWFENLQREEVPPERLWVDAKGLDDWFETIAEKRGIGPSSSSDDESPELVGNDLARPYKD